MKTTLLVSALWLSIIPGLLTPASAAPIHRSGIKTSGHKNSARPKIVHKYSSLISAIKANDAEAVLVMLRNGADPNETEQTRTALMFAVQHDSLKITRMLLARGADPKAADQIGWSALDWVVDSPALERLLRSRGATKAPPVPDLEVSSDSLETEVALGTHYIDGIVTNNSGKAYDFVKIDAVFLDDTGTQIDSGFDITEHLAAGSDWKFKISSFRDGITKYKIVKVSGQ